jgi:DNA-binding GntR family transcriptional regulator
VVACADNAFLADIYDHIGGALKLSVSPELWDRALAVEEVALHQDLVESIAAGDEARAEAAAGRLVETLRDALLPPEATPAKSQAKSARKRSAARRM